jgi:hypothetical protein
VFDRDLEEEEKEDRTPPPWLSDDEFLEKYQMSHESFNILVDLIKDCSVF